MSSGACSMLSGRENHPGLKDAKEQARQNSIEVAVSNPCFEIWLILHFQDHTAWLDNNDARRVRRKLDNSTDKGLNAAAYMPLVADAARRAVELDNRHLRDVVSFPNNNPSSGMHRLIATVKPDNR
jgi:hypothetical protein